jgi:hypothetical protein
MAVEIVPLISSKNHELAQILKEHEVRQFIFLGG